MTSPTSAGTKVEEVDMLMKFDDVNADFRYKITVNGDDVVTVGSHNGTEIQTERFKLGVKRQEQFESISGSVRYNLSLLALLFGVVLELRCPLAYLTYHHCGNI